MLKELIERARRLFASEHKRVCRKCHKLIKRHHRWHQVKIGWFSPWFCCEHWDCANPLRDPHAVAPYVGPELPFPRQNEEDHALIHDTLEALL